MRLNFTKCRVLTCNCNAGRYHIKGFNGLLISVPGSQPCAQELQPGAIPVATIHVRSPGKLRLVAPTAGKVEKGQIWRRLRASSDLVAT